MNTIDLNSKNVFNQFAVKTPVQSATYALNNNEGDKFALQKQTEEPKVKKEKKGVTALKIVAGAAAAAALIAGSVQLSRFKEYYNKGVKIIQDKDKYLKKINSDVDFQNFLEKQPYSAKEVEYFKEIYRDCDMYQNNIVGKLYRFKMGITNFFKDNFYNY